MRGARRAWVALLASAATSLGCVSGLVYTHVIVPLDVNFDRTPVHDDQERDSQNSFQFYLRVDWGSDGIGDVAKRYGFERIDYADFETLSVLGIWTQHWARIYGEK